MNPRPDVAISAENQWGIASLSEVCHIKPSKSIARKLLKASDDVSFVPMNDLGELQKYFKAHKTRSFEDVVKGYTYFADGDVLCAKITPCFENGKLGIAGGLINGVGFGSSEFVVMRSKGKIVPEFLYYYLSRARFRKEGARIMSGAVGHKRVPKEYFENLPIPLPPVGEQKKIVAVLDQAFAALDRARAHAEANLANVEALFTTIVFTNLQSVVSTGGLVPLGRIAEHCLGKMLDKKKNKGKYRPYLRNINVRWFELDTRDVLDMRIEDHETNRYEVKRGDLLICEGGYPGRACIYQSDETVYFQKALHRVRFRDEFLPKILMYWLFLQDRTGTLKIHFTGTGISHFTGKSLAKFPMPVADWQTNADSIRIIESCKTTIDELRLRYEKKLSDITNLRQSLLQKAFAGELV